MATRWVVREATVVRSRLSRFTLLSCCILLSRCIAWIRELGGDAPDTAVANGGLSLRHVQSFLRILERPLNRFVPVFRWRTLAWRICLFRRYDVFAQQRPIYLMKRSGLFC